MPDGHSHPPRVRPATVPLCLKLGLCLCIKPAKSVSRICKSASRRQSSSTLPCYRRACFRQAVLFLHSHQTPEKRAPVLFRAAKRVRLALQPSPGLTLLDILGNRISLDRCLHFSLAAAAGTTITAFLRCVHQTTGPSSPFPHSRERICPASAATHGNLFVQATTATSSALAPVKTHQHEADRTRPALSSDVFRHLHCNLQFTSRSLLFFLGTTRCITSRFSS
jgi:hypothetical protein